MDPGPRRLNTLPAPPTQPNSCRRPSPRRGCAHICEHLAFNATERFDNHAIVHFLEMIGAAFGPCQNAYTSADETVYELLVPLDGSGLRQGLEVLSEFACKTRIAAGDLEKERGAVLEEWRQGRDSRGRAFEAWWKARGAERPAAFSRVAISPHRFRAPSAATNPTAPAGRSRPPRHAIRRRGRADRCAPLETPLRVACRPLRSAQVLYGDGSRYSERLPIGLEKVIRSAPAEVVKGFYQKWYRPEHMAVVAVGDFPDRAAVVELIKEAFGGCVRAGTRRHGNGDAMHCDAPCVRHEAHTSPCPPAPVLRRVAPHPSPAPPLVRAPHVAHAAPRFLAFVEKELTDSLLTVSYKRDAQVRHRPRCGLFNPRRSPASLRLGPPALSPSPRPLIDGGKSRMPCAEPRPSARSLARSPAPTRAARARRPQPIKTPAQFRQQLVEDIFCSALSHRLFKLSRRPDPPYYSAGCVSDDPVSAVNVFFLDVQTPVGKVVPALESVLTEVARVRLHGAQRRAVPRPAPACARCADGNGRLGSHAVCVRVLKRSVVPSLSPGQRGRNEIPQASFPGRFSLQRQRWKRAWRCARVRGLSAAYPLCTKPPASLHLAVASPAHTPCALRPCLPACLRLRSSSATSSTAPLSAMNTLGTSSLASSWSVRAPYIYIAYVAASLRLALLCCAVLCCA